MTVTRSWAPFKTDRASSAKDPRKGKRQDRRRDEGGVKVQAISGSRSDYASVANESLSRRLVKNLLYIRSHYWPHGAATPSTLSPSLADQTPSTVAKLLCRENKEKIGKRFNRESGVNYCLAIGRDAYASSRYLKQPHRRTRVLNKFPFDPSISKEKLTTKKFNEPRNQRVDAYSSRKDRRLTNNRSILLKAKFSLYLSILKLWCQSFLTADRIRGERTFLYDIQK